ncbi:MAG: TonB-dependent receptor [Pedobacter sp.]
MRITGQTIIPLVLLSCSVAYGAEEKSSMIMDSLTVKGTPGTEIVEQSNEPATRSIIPKETVDLLTGPAKTNPYKALDLLPSVHSEGADAFGLTVDQNPLRIRGQVGDTFTRLSRTIEGLPLGVNVGQGSMGNMLDLENISEMSLIRGAVPVDKGFGFGNTAGALDQSLLWGAKTMGLSLMRSDGSEHFNRTFVRVDSGELKTKTRLFASASYSEADKWRGSGNGERSNVSAGITTVSVYGVFNTFRQHAYRPLTYAQTQSESFYRDYDYNSSLVSPVGTTTALQNINYYDYNRQRFNEYGIFSVIDINPTANSYLTFKPYFSGSKGYRSFGSGTTNANAVINRTDITQEQLGFTSEYGITLGPTQVKLGYWYQDADTIPPPTSQKSYNIAASGLTFKSWGLLTKVGSRTFHEPYLAVNNRFGKLKVDVGVKYVRINLPEVTGYNTTGLVDSSYDTAMSASSGTVAGLHANGSVQEAWLPNAGVSYEFNEHNNVRLTYGLNYAGAWQGPLYSVFKSNQAAFTAAGVTLQNLWDGAKLEISDNIDLGAKFGDETWHLSPTLFYGKFHDKQVMVFDPRVNTSYYQSNASAESMGAELEVGLTPVPWLSFFGSASYNSFKFDNNIRTAAATMVQSKGKQVADAPEWLGKVGVTARYADFSITPIMRYVGERYGDVENKERISDYEVVDLNLEYRKKKVWGFDELTVSLNLLNLFDKKYVGIIKNDQDVSEALTTTYYPGAPFTVVGSVGIKF